MFIFMIVALSMAYLIGLLVKNETSISMVGNILGLGCSFLGGIFVPISMLSEGVIRLAHFLPTYWYTQAINLEDLTLRFQYMGIQLVFACMFFVVGAAVMHLKRTAFGNLFICNTPYRLISIIC